MLINIRKFSETASTGTISTNTPALRGMCRQILVEPATSSTTYDIKITNPDDITVYERISETGTLSELIDLPLRGIHTIIISNATVDELFLIQLVINE